MHSPSTPSLFIERCPQAKPQRYLQREISQLKIAAALGLAAATFLLSAASSHADPERGYGERVIPRTIIGLYDKSSTSNWRDHPLHQMVEMPLNHLGLVLEPHDVNEALPDLTGRSDIRGVLTWLDNSIEDPSAYLDWAEAVLDAQIPYVVFGNFGFTDPDAAAAVAQDRADAFLNRLAFRQVDRDYDPGYSATASLKIPSMVEYERKLPPRLSLSGAIEALDPRADIYLSATREGTDQTFDLVVVGPKASFVAQDYTHFYVETSFFRQWFINPFRFLEEAFSTQNLPKPDITTAVGRRIYFSHVDGDGWRNWPDIEPYRSRKQYAIDVIIDRIIEAYPDLPVTVAPIAGDLDPDWCGGAAARAAATELFAHPHVEAASHTYSHPFFWRMFEHGSPAFESFASIGCEGEKGIIAAAPQPRAYHLIPFDLDLEIDGAARYIEQFLPPGKSIELLQWSGDTGPTASMLKAVSDAGMLNINGGDSRFDSLFPSVSYVSPIGLSVDGEQQIYAAASNENTYTELWTARFYGFRKLKDTLDNTEHPRRLKPINVYYHVYSGERLASLNALIQNLEFVRTQEIVPIWTSTYARIAEGFYSTRLIRIGPNSWRVEERGELQTIRFDEAPHTHVDLSRSRGVLGWRHHQESLYVALDPAHAAPVIALALPTHAPSRAERPRLIQSRWLIEDLAWDDKGFSFEAGGFGRGAIVWQMPGEATYEIIDSGNPAGEAQVVATSPEGVLRIDLPFRGPDMRTVSVKLKDGGST